MAMIACRCYEIQCSTGVVVGNYSTATATPTAIPYNTSTGFIEPGLDYDTVADDYNRYWNGNPLMSKDELFTQCWNGTQVAYFHHVLHNMLVMPCPSNDLVTTALKDITHGWLHLFASASDWICLSEIPLLTVCYLMCLCVREAHVEEAATY